MEVAPSSGAGFNVGRILPIEPCLISPHRDAITLTYFA